MRSKLIATFGVIVAVVAALLWREAVDVAHAQQPPAAPPVIVATPIKQEITEWDEFTGRFEPVDLVEVRSRVSGFLEQVKFKPGDIVNKGDLLFVIDQEPFQIAADLAKAQLQQALAQLKLAKSETERARPLVERNALPERELEVRLATQQEAEGKVVAARAGVRQAELDLNWTEVRAPISGRISDTRIDAGNLITGGQADGTLMTTIVSVSPIHFYFEGSEQDYLKYVRLAQEGQRPSSRDAENPVAVKLVDEKDFSHKGVVDFVDNAIDTQSGTIRARAVFKNEDKVLLPGLFGRLRLFGGKSEALLVPDKAIASDQSRKIVMTVDGEGTVSQKVVALGPIVDGLRVVRKGLSADDKIIISGLLRARPGSKVKVEEGKIEPPEVAANQ